MSIAYVIDDVFLGHRPPRSHPERPERLIAVRDALRQAGLQQRGQKLPTRAATDAEIGLVHTAGYFDELCKRVPGSEGWLDGDTYFSTGTWDAVLAAAGAVVDVTRATLSGSAPSGLAVVRPPGHHAEADRAMGFCLLNNVAIAAAAARDDGASRVAVLDWDVHHGNGTQNIFYDDPTVLYLSCHQHPYYPGTGRPEECGRGAGLGTTVNVGLPAGCGDGEYRATFDQVFEPALRRFAPDIIIVSAGFDAYRDDPLADMRVTGAGFLAMARSLCRLADELCAGRIVYALEGGYDLGGLASGTLAVLEAMERAGQTAPATADETPPGEPRPGEPRPAIDPRAQRAIAQTLECVAHSQTSQPGEAP